MTSEQEEVSSEYEGRGMREREIESKWAVLNGANWGEKRRAGVRSPRIFTLVLG